MKITVYSTQTCAYCAMLKRWLDEKSLEYTNHNVDEDSDAAAEMVRLSGQMGVPFSTIELNDGRVAKILGFDTDKFESVLSAAKQS